MADEDPVAQFEVNSGTIDKASARKNQVRQIIADVYTFVRSRELNKTVSSFTLDHYIDEAKRRIKDPRILRAASDPVKGAGTRPAQLSSIEKLEQEFSKAFEEAAKIAAAVEEPE